MFVVELVGAPATGKSLLYSALSLDSDVNFIDRRGLVGYSAIPQFLWDWVDLKFAQKVYRLIFWIKFLIFTVRSVVSCVGARVFNKRFGRAALIENFAKEGSSCHYTYRSAFLYVLDKALVARVNSGYFEKLPYQFFFLEEGPIGRAPYGMREDMHRHCMLVKHIFFLDVSYFVGLNRIVARRKQSGRVTGRHKSLQWVKLCETYFEQRSKFAWKRSELADDAIFIAENVPLEARCRLFSRTVN